MSDAAAITTTLLGAAPAALLLWLAAAAFGQACADADAHTSRLLGALAFLLATAALCWPALDALESVAGVFGASMLAASGAMLAIAVVLAAAASTGPGRWFGPRRIGCAVSAWVVTAAALAVVTMNAGSGATAWVLHSVIGGGAIVASLVLLCWPGSGRRATLIRAAAALMGGTIPAFSMPAPVGASVTISDWATPVALALVGAFVHLLLQRFPAARHPHTSTPLRRESDIDALTGLLTRAGFEHRLDRAMQACDRAVAEGRKSAMALMFIDLDGFKPVNDTFGHASGDGVLRVVGERLRELRSDGQQMAARVGGDEFLLLVKGYDLTQDAVARRARQIVQSLSRPYEVEGRQVGISCSIGIAFYPDGGNAAKLVARADAAMYAAKRAGGAGFAFFSPAMEDDARDRFDLLRDLRTALERNELELYYQPKIDVKTGKVTAAEALLRWLHPTRGMVAPGVFMPIAERFGLIRDIGHWVIEDACRQARKWQDAGLRMRVAINLSAVQMRQPDIVERIEEALKRHQIDPARLTCEITESVAMEDTKATQTTFQRLGAAGIHLSIDDFGTGYSSLAYLRKLPAAELKIDRSFVTDVEHSADARSVIDAVIKLAHALGLKVVAEGIENERQSAILAQAGCDEFQGFLFAKPMTARSLLLWALDDHKQRAEGFATSLFVSTMVGNPSSMQARALH